MMWKVAAGGIVIALAASILMAVPAYSGSTGSAPGHSTLAVVPSTSSGKAAYAGYLGVVTSGNISTQTAEFTVPSVSCQPSLPEAQVAAVNVGGAGVLGNGSDVQVGAEVAAVCARTASVPEFSLTDYICLLSSCPTLHGINLSVSGGDGMSVQIQIVPRTGALAWNLTDRSTGSSATWVDHVGVAVELSRPYWEVEGPIDPCTPTSCAQALAEFATPLRLHDCGVGVNGGRLAISSLAFLIRYTLVNSIDGTLAHTSALSAHGSAFSVVWNRST